MRRSDPPWVWECSNGDGQWTEIVPSQLPGEKDTTGGLNNPRGQLVFYLPLTMKAAAVHGRNAYWLRCRLERRREEQGMYTQSPRVAGVVAYTLGGTAFATHAVAVRDEILGQTTGNPGQVFHLQHAPVLALRPEETIAIEELRDGELVITGRAKDIVFVNGQNYYPHDLERVAEGVEGISLGKVAICGVSNEGTGSEDVAAFVVSTAPDEEVAALARRLVAHVSEKTGVPIAAVVRVRHLPKTTSGKVERFKLGQMLARGEGVIINLVDLFAWQPSAGFAAHSVTKAGLLALTRQLALELAPAVRVNAVAPGPVLPPPSYDAARIERLAQKTLLKRWGSPDDVTQAVVFLIQSDFITGDCITVDGGERYGHW